MPFPNGEIAVLRAARSDPKVLSRAMLQAFVDFLRAECGRRPVLLGIDDLQWGDGPSVALLGAALRELSDQPLLVVALGRPDVSTTFPQLWAAKVQEISLSGLSRKAGERLICEVLGHSVDSATLSRIVSQAAGNALYLEELIRAEASGRGQKMPASILAMLQARLSYLEPGARRLLRAASIRLVPRANFRWSHPMRASFLMLFGRPLASPSRSRPPNSSPNPPPNSSLNLPLNSLSRPSPSSQKN